MSAPKHPIRVSFPGHDGIPLVGILHPATGSPKGAVLLSHCFTCTKEYKILAWLSRELAGRGYVCLRFDFAGLGESGGDFAATTLSTNIADLLAAGRFLLSRHPLPLTLVGHSMGGAAAILAATQLPEARILVALGTSSRLGWRVQRLVGEVQRYELEVKGITRIQLGDSDYPLTREFLADLDRYSLLDVVSSWDRALLVVQGTADRVIPPAESEALFAAARFPKAYLTLPEADHMFIDNRRQAPLMAVAIDVWMQLNGGMTR